MHAGLGLEVAVGVRALDGERRALDARTLAGLLLEQLRPEAAPLAPTEIHPQQHLGPVLRLEAAGAGMDLDDPVAGIVLAAEELVQLEGRDVALDLVELLAELVERVGIAFLGELEEDLRLVRPLTLAFPAADRVEDLRRLAPDGLRLLGVVPEAGCGRLLAQLGGALLEARQVKGASRARRRVRGARARARGTPRAASDRSRGSPAPSRFRHHTGERERTRGPTAPLIELDKQGFDGASSTALGRALPCGRHRAGSWWPFS